MRHRFSLLGPILLLLSCAAVAQQTGRLTVSVQSVVEQAMPAAPVNGAKVVVVHWTKAELHPALVQDQIATTDQMGNCVLELPPGTYDIFISAYGRAPAALRRDVHAGEDTNVFAKLKAAPSHLKPVN